jgi:tetratricopeptide (TPR) repeat protein
LRILTRFGRVVGQQKILLIFLRRDSPDTLRVMLLYNMKKIGFLFLLIGLIIAGCVTTKKKGDVSRFKRGYNSLTTHYNYWFNANEILRLKEAELTKGYKDNYNQLLPLYPEMAGETPAKKEFETAEKKAATGIGLHQTGTWVDDCYLLMGQAQYYKRDYETAETTFSYLREEHNPNKKVKTKLKKTSSKKKSAKKVSKRKKAKAKKKAAAKKKKEAEARKKELAKQRAEARKNGTPLPKNKPATTEPKPADTKKKDDNPEDEFRLEVTGKNPYRLHRREAAYPEAMVWYGRTLIEREKYEEAEILFRELHEDPWFPKRLQDDLAKAEAHLWIEQKMYDKAGLALNKAIKYAKNKKDRARMAFIQAQLLEMAGQKKEAFEALAIVLKSKPDFVLEFNTRLHQIMDGWHASIYTSTEANSRLERMLKESKNSDYRDQIYFTLGEIALADNKKKEAIAYFAQSLAASAGNATQRAESYLRLADLYYEIEDFVSAKAYYDSTITVLSNADERFARAQRSAKDLAEIARLITTIEANDSIVRVFNMSDAERRALAKKIQKERDDAAAKAAAAAAAKPTGDKGRPVGPISAAGIKPSTFYFYSDAAIKKGKRDFEKNWGDRKLEDNWRRSQRLVTGGSGDDQAGADKSDDPTKAQKSEEEMMAEIFKNIPRNQAELSVIHLATYEAMFKLGTLFRDKLENNPRCVGTLEDMQGRYPDTARFDKETWYYCFLAHTDLRNQPRAQYYLDKLVAKYPNSPYTKSITDPNFANASKEKERELNVYYEQTYATFSKGDYKTAFSRCEEAPKKYGSTNAYTPKFALLSALCIGNLQGTEAYCKALAEVIARFPDSPESTRAKEIARLLACKGFEGAGTTDAKKPEIDEAFVTEHDKLHYFMVVLTGSDIKLENVKNAISDYNRENHKSEQLRLSNIFLGTSQDQPIIVLRKFDNKEKGLKYLNEVKNKKDFLGENNKTTYEKEFFIITQENYRRVLKNKTLDGYREFFQSNYSK